MIHQNFLVSKSKDVIDFKKYVFVFTLNSIIASSGTLMSNVNVCLQDGLKPVRDA
jgi:hypothetical protein